MAYRQVNRDCIRQWTLVSPATPTPKVTGSPVMARTAW
jgi:hypothetical protein